MRKGLSRFVDDARGVPDETLLYRRISWAMIGGRDRCPSGEQAQLSTNCFRDYREADALAHGYPGPCMSIGVGAVLVERGLQPQAILTKFEGCGLAAVRAGDLRALSRFDGSPCPHGIMLSPTEDEPWHGVVFDCEPGARPKSVALAIQRIAHWVIPLVNHGQEHRRPDPTAK